MASHHKKLVQRLVPPVLSCAVILASAVSVSATTKEETLALCRTEMKEAEGAVSLNEVDFRRHDGVPFVYGDAEFADGAKAHFRCRVYHNRVTSVRYLTGDPAYSGGRAWTAGRPAGDEFEDLELDEAARTAPEPAEFEPHFEKVPTKSE